MGRAQTVRWIGVLTLLAILALAVSTQAQMVPVASGSMVNGAASAWLVQAQPGATATFLVGVTDDGTQAQVDRARGIVDKLQRRIEVNRLLRERADRNQAALQGFIQAQGLGSEITAVQAYAAFNGFSITATQQAVNALRAWNRVSSIELDTPIQLDVPMAGTQEAQVNAVEWNINKIGADRVQTELNINGAGITIGGLDSGVRSTHEALRDNYKCRGGSNTNCWLDAISGQTTPYDDNNHGTHTMGTSVGTNGIGVAPGAQWIACKAFNAAGSGNQTDILECFDWFLAPGGSAANAPDVVNNSWGSSNGSNTAYQQAVTNWVNAGIYPAFSNGNSGPSCNTVGSPASYSNAVGTGATDINDVIASFSSRGPSPFGPSKPDLSAPGVNVRSSVASSDTAYSSFNGTSMAAPHVTGLVAMLLQANPSLTIDQLTANMKTNALGIAATGCNSSGVPNNIYGSGRIRAYESVLAAQGGTPPPTPTPGPVLPTPTPGPVPPTPTPAPAPPAAPSNLSAGAVSSTQINLTWTDNSTTESGFRIERCQGRFCSNFAEIATVGAGVTSFQNTGLSPRSVYSYRVRAFNSAGNSGYTNVATARTPR
ncbi:MAG: S8 family serine peptidase [Chloroflexaceae bacterium]|jgi:bacillopeptidase F|nr:S8 family serine peptidase [Chloroflexaceae bacterium]